MLAAAVIPAPVYTEAVAVETFVLEFYDLGESFFHKIHFKFLV